MVEKVDRDSYEGGEIHAPGLGGREGGCRDTTSNSITNSNSNKHALLEEEEKGKKALGGHNRNGAVKESECGSTGFEDGEGNNTQGLSLRSKEQRSRVDVDSKFIVTMPKNVEGGAKGTGEKDPKVKDCVPMKRRVWYRCLLAVLVEKREAASRKPSLGSNPPPIRTKAVEKRRREAARAEGHKGLMAGEVDGDVDESIEAEEELEEEDEAGGDEVNSDDDAQDERVYPSLNVSKRLLQRNLRKLCGKEGTKHPNGCKRRLLECIEEMNPCRFGIYLSSKGVERWEDIHEEIDWKIVRCLLNMSSQMSERSNIPGNMKDCMQIYAATAQLKVKFKKIPSRSCLESTVLGNEMLAKASDVSKVTFKSVFCLADGRQRNEVGDFFRMRMTGYLDPEKLGAFVWERNADSDIEETGSLVYHCSVLLCLSDKQYFKHMLSRGKYDYCLAFLETMDVDRVTWENNKPLIEALGVVAGRVVEARVYKMYERVVSLMDRLSAFDELADFLRGIEESPEDSKVFVSEGMCSVVGNLMLTLGFSGQAWVETFQPILTVLLDKSRKYCFGEELVARALLLETLKPLFEDSPVYVDEYITPELTMFISFCAKLSSYEYEGNFRWEVIFRLLDSMDEIERCKMVAEIKQRIVGHKDISVKTMEGLSKYIEGKLPLKQRPEMRQFLCELNAHIENTTIRNFLSKEKYDAGAFIEESKQMKPITQKVLLQDNPAVVEDLKQILFSKVSNVCAQKVLKAIKDSNCFVSEAMSNMLSEVYRTLALLLLPYIQSQIVRLESALARWLRNNYEMPNTASSKIEAIKTFLVSPKKEAYVLLNERDPTKVRKFVQKYCKTNKQELYSVTCESVEVVGEQTRLLLVKNLEGLYGSQEELRQEIISLKANAEELNFATKADKLKFGREIVNPPFPSTSLIASGSAPSTAFDEGPPAKRPRTSELFDTCTELSDLPPEFTC
eukprot:Nk52_evm19s327 gene=Nk52_evmTU19s327